MENEYFGFYSAIQDRIIGYCEHMQDGKVVKCTAIGRNPTPTNHDFPDLVNVGKIEAEVVNRSLKRLEYIASFIEPC